MDLFTTLVVIIVPTVASLAWNEVLFRTQYDVSFLFVVYCFANPFRSINDVLKSGDFL